MAFFEQIKNFSVKHPLAVQGLVGATIQVVGDLISQKKLEEKEKLDFQRCRNSFILGWATGFVLGSWYKYLDRKIYFSRKFSTVLCKVAADQIIFAKAFVTIAAMNYDDFLPEKMLTVIRNEKNNFPDSMIVSHKLWPSVQAINFYLLSLRYQVAFNCLCATAWNFFAFHCKHSKGHGDREVEALQEWVLKSVEN